MARITTPLCLLLFLLFIHNSFQQPLSNVDLGALQTIKNSLTDLPGSDFFSTWDFSSTDPCNTFSGIICSLDDNVTPPLLRIDTLTLGTGLADSPGLTGSLTPSLSNLDALTQLILYSGIASGPIPSELGNLKNLRVISLTNNRLSGPIPTTLATLPNLHTLDLSGNQLSGSIPAGLAGLTELRVLILASNSLSGELPDVTTQLLHLDLKQNNFSGRLPSLPSSLRYFSVSQNQMWGPLDALDPLSELVYLDLSMNQFNGSIPESLFHYRLSSMLLQRNNLSGGIPRAVSVDVTSYGEGSVVDLSHNFLSGELSSVLAGVESVFLNNNHLMGIVPEDYARSVYEGNMKTLYLQHNFFSGFPLDSGLSLPDSVSLCLSYNCMVPPVGLTACPASAGDQLWRPAYQCSVYNNGTTVEGEP
ncbi:PREDICTED: probable LRR receptor-like serine/threonine-protein kinase At4g36180 [Nelumbo nucifera]|uniref:Leucine-rich repeat-containing N-terminal plant-type domain-containing protein n=2 Tax=Nelumbo nucifera TaxID=4432 RepID=A0A822ZCY6_NELNU|nr:PREDICTED: probable LRR receptor-like serine/threonine-protein kinase At4g36180 [Nelumbo nucifera]DAD44074.1 TPA_asm: hypothetical protein HUJ06_002304 [Nelumbo nucifera]